MYRCVSPPFSHFLDYGNVQALQGIALLAIKRLQSQDQESVRGHTEGCAQPCQFCGGCSGLILHTIGVFPPIRAGLNARRAAATRPYQRLLWLALNGDMG